MKLEYFMDLDEKSVSIGHTPVMAYQRLPFCIQGYGYFNAGSKYFTEREGLDNYLLMYTLSGCGYLEYKNAEYILEANKAVVFNCSQYHYYKTASQMPWEFKYVHFGGAAAREYDEMINGDSLSIIAMGEKSQINSMLDGVCQLVSGDEVLADIKICNALMNILSEMITSRHSPLNNRKYNQHKAEFDGVINFICDNYERKISTDDLAALVLMSKYHFLRLFKEYAGLSPYEYLIRHRINIAKSLLKDTTLGVNQISCRVGFSDVNNFTRYFKRLAGTTPASYRRYWIQ